MAAIAGINTFAGIEKIIGTGPRGVKVPAGWPPRGLRGIHPREHFKNTHDRIP